MNNETGLSVSELNIMITEAIKRNDGNISAAGRELGISPRMMNYRMNKLGMNTK